MDISEHAAEQLAPYRGKKLVVAVSGGLDSVALLDLLLRLRDELQLGLIVAHADHGLRRSSKKDAEFVEKLAAAYSLPFVGTQLGLKSGGNLEARCREARYRWLEQVRKRRKATAIITAHQADDQVETLFLNLTRGSGLTGLSGMQASKGTLIRPLLDVPRKDLARYVRRHRLRYRLDPSNRNLKFARNRVRRQVITSLSKINPQLVETVSQSMRVLDEEYEILRHLAQAELQRATLKAGPQASHAQGRASSVNLSVPRLLRMRRGVRHLVWREALRALHGNLTGFRLRHLENLDGLVQGQTGGRIHLPHQIVALRTHHELQLRVAGKAAKPPKRAALPVPGKAPFGEWMVSARLRKTVQSNSIAVDRAAVGSRLVVRSPKIGDRFKPAGMRGSKLLSDLLTDAKIPRDERAWVPVVTTSRGEIVWVVGHRADRRFAADPARSAVVLTAVEAGR